MYETSLISLVTNKKKKNIQPDKNISLMKTAYKITAIAAIALSTFTTAQACNDSLKLNCGSSDSFKYWEGFDIGVNGFLNSTSFSNSIMPAHAALPGTCNNTTFTSIKTTSIW
jgi:hypothetical protein